MKHADGWTYMIVTLYVHFMRLKLTQK